MSDFNLRVGEGGEGERMGRGAMDRMLRNQDVEVGVTRLLPSLRVPFRHHSDNHHDMYVNIYI